MLLCRSNALVGAWHAWTSGNAGGEAVRTVSVNVYTTEAIVRAMTATAGGVAAPETESLPDAGFGPGLRRRLL